MQPMQLVALGLNHHTAPIAIRERVAFQPERLIAALGELVSLPAVQEAAIVSTCNRTELYCATQDPQQAADWLAAYHRLSLPDISPYLYSHPDNDAVRHVFRVASGLDSMVLGEPQILGQLKEAVRLAETAGSLGSTLHRLFQKSFSVAKEVRSTTAIGESVVSMAAAAVRLSERIFGDMRQTRVLFVGAGEMVALAAAHFAGSSPQRISIANRTLARAEQLAERVRGDAMSLSSVGERLADYDVVVSCTGSPLPIIGHGMAERALKARRQRPMVMVDLAVPRDIESEVARLSNVFLYTVDDLVQIVSEGKALRQAAVQDAEVIIDLGVLNFAQWVDGREAVPTIRALRGHAELLRQEELARAQRALSRGEAPEQVMEQLSRGLTNKLLHGPSQFLNRADVETAAGASATVRQVFNLDSPPDSTRGEDDNGKQ
ncbi:MAG: glutamyl-tRNA reductase [Rhodocyclales bacterium]|nr:glutamyl-tRNA reductase [Rhodocyclales bacterium]